MKLKDMTDHDILITLVGEQRAIKKCLTNHLAHHEKNENRLWKVIYIVIGVSLTTIAGLIIV